MAQSLIYSLLRSDEQIGAAINSALTSPGKYTFLCDDYEHAQGVYQTMAIGLFDEIRRANPATRTIELCSGSRLKIALVH